MISEKINTSFLGSLFAYYRNAKKLSRYELINLINKNEYCFSYATLRRIEEGKKIKNDKYYAIYANSLELNFCDDFEIYDELYTKMNALNNSINIIDVIELKDKFYKYFLDAKDNLKDCIYLSELANMSFSAIESYINNKIDNFNIINILEECYYSLTGVENQLASSLLFKITTISKYRTRQNINAYNKYGKDIVSKNIFYLDEIFYDTETLDNLEIYKKYNELLLKDKEDNDIYTFSLLFKIAIAECQLGSYKESLDHLNKAIKIKDIQNKIPAYIYYYVLRRMGIVQYKTKNYEKALYYFEKVRNYNKEILGCCYILMFDTLENLSNVSHLLEVINNDKNSISNNKIKRVFIYYEMKFNNYSNDILEDYLLKQLPLNEFNNPMFIEIFKLQMLKVINKTKHYKSLYDYIK